MPWETQQLSMEDIEAGLKDGSIKRVHLYQFINILKPRGSMLKESIGLYLAEVLLDTYESWSNPEYGDNPTEEELLHQLKTNLDSEVDAAFKTFLHCKDTDEKLWEYVYRKRDERKNSKQ